MAGKESAEYMENVLSYLKRDVETMGRFDERLEFLKTDVKKLQRFVLEGNGASVLSQVLMMQVEIKALQDTIAVWVRDEKAMKSQRKQIIVAITIAVVSGLMTIAVALLKR